MTRYVLLRIDDDAQASDLLYELAVYPDAHLDTPNLGRPVQATVMALGGPEHPAVDTPAFKAIERSYAEHAWWRVNDRIDKVARRLAAKDA